MDARRSADEMPEAFHILLECSDKVAAVRVATRELGKELKLTPEEVGPTPSCRQIANARLQNFLRKKADAKREIQQALSSRKR